MHRILFAIVLLALGITAGAAQNTGVIKERKGGARLVVGNRVELFVRDVPEALALALGTRVAEARQLRSHESGRAMQSPSRNTQ